MQTNSRPLRPRRATPAVVVVLFVVSSIGLAAPGSPSDATTRPSQGTVAPSGCPWVAAEPNDLAADDALAAEVDGQMTLSDKLGLLNLAPVGAFENENTGVPALCIPPLTLQDGPNGLAYADTGVTQLPASLATGATFDPKLAWAYGHVIGSQARRQGIDVVQGPNLDLVRVPQSGRAFEEFGEDPYLAGVLGAADIRGIQSAGVAAAAKHFAGYTQETDRLTLDQDISVRTLEEVDFAPFKMAVEDASVASIMCAYGEIDGVYTCEDPFLFSTLASWGFTGFVRSDLGSVADPVAAFAAGLDMVKPAATSLLSDAVASGALPMAAIDRSVEAVLTEMFRFGMIQHPRGGVPRRDVETPAAISVARRDAEESIVLLKDSHGVLPLEGSHLGTLAVIGTDAASGAVVTGGGSAQVKGPFEELPLEALRSRLERRAHVVYAPGVAAAAPTTVVGPAVTALDQAAAGPTFTPGGSALGLSAPADLVSPAVATASSPGSGPGWTSVSSTYDPPESGDYQLSVTNIGDTFVSVDGSPVYSADGIRPSTTDTVGVELIAGGPVTISVTWYRVAGFADPTIGITDETPAIDQAIAAASGARTAIVFVGAPESESIDRPSLELPGTDDELIDAVAAVNHRTVVVLNTGGAVLMPWLARVGAVLESWYPGEEDGRAITAVLTGAVDPSGRLPITFPSSPSETPTASPAEYPGVDGTVTAAEGLAIGYRWYLANHVAPLFAFGFGLDYTTFTMRLRKVVRRSGADLLEVAVDNTGSRAGSEVVQAYLHFPAASGEPPFELAGFGRITLGAHASGVLDVSVPKSSFEDWQGTGFGTEAGSYEIAIGSSSTSRSRLRPVPVP